jgi:hypothetical protein
VPYISSKYDCLFLSDEYIEDSLLLALAWKKSHEYIRTINWYADNFDLDKSALNLAWLCRKWSSDVKGEIVFTPLKLVPAPKTSAWDFFKNKCPDFMELLSLPISEIDDVYYCLEWAPSEAGKTKLRPLAHIGIKEQTLMTLVMMCLANEVESLQGDPTTDYKEVHDKKIVSYGNRLYCTYDNDGRAEHNFGGKRQTTPPTKLNSKALSYRDRHRFDSFAAH